MQSTDMLTSCATITDGVEVGSVSVLRASHVFVETGARLPYGAPITLLLPDTAGLGNLELPGVVRWWSDRGIGVQLDRLRPREVRALHRWMERGHGPRLAFIAGHVTEHASVSVH